MTSSTVRPASRLARQTFRSCRNSHAASQAQLQPFLSVSCFSTSSPRPREDDTTSFNSSAETQAPRWARTPERMKASFSPHVTKNPQNSVWHVNEDPQKLDNALNNLLGKGGERLLPDELKWLAVTHKSFDQGRRGFNDRLAFLGRQIAVMEAMQSILTGTGPSATEGGKFATEIEADPFNGRREPVQDPALQAADRLSVMQPDAVFNLDSLRKLAAETGLTEVVRWKPRKTESLKASGIAPVMSGAIFAIVGAISLQQGGKVASRIVRERIIRKIKLQ